MDDSLRPVWAGNGTKFQVDFKDRGGKCRAAIVDKCPYIHLELYGPDGDLLHTSANSDPFSVRELLNLFGGAHFVTEDAELTKELEGFGE